VTGGALRALLGVDLADRAGRYAYGRYRATSPMPASSISAAVTASEARVPLMLTTCGEGTSPA